MSEQLEQAFELWAKSLGDATVAALSVGTVLLQRATLALTWAAVKLAPKFRKSEKK